MISVVSPVYMAEGIIDELIKRLKEVLCLLGQYEIILIDDCSTDKSWEKIKMAQGIRAYRNDKNKGQHATIKRGVEMALGDWIVVMDCDLQDNPYEIPKLYAKALMGYPIVYARRLNIKESRMRLLCAAAFHKCYSARLGFKTDQAIANFAIYSKGYFGMTNCQCTTIDVEHCARYQGTSSYSLFKLLKLAIKFLR